MHFVTAIMLFLIGVLGAASLIVAKKPNAKEAIAKLAPYQGWIGAVAFCWGVWGAISAVLNLGWIGGGLIIPWATLLAASVVELVLGLLLGLGLLKTYIKNPKAQAQLDARAARLAPKQGVFGFVSIGLSVWLLLVSILHIGWKV